MPQQDEWTPERIAAREATIKREYYARELHHAQLGPAWSQYLETRDIEHLMEVLQKELDRRRGND
jgi:hypothetical protein